VLRPTHFRDHASHFLLQLKLHSSNEPSSSEPSSSEPSSSEPSSSEPSSSEQAEYVCLRVPPHLHERCWADLLRHHSTELTDQLVLHASAVTDILSKLEGPEFIHVYVDAVSRGDGRDANEQGALSRVHAL
jgi:hypothetical protein